MKFLQRRKKKLKRSKTQSNTEVKRPCTNTINCLINVPPINIFEDHCPCLPSPPQTQYHCPVASSQTVPPNIFDDAQSPVPLNIFDDKSAIPQASESTSQTVPSNILNDAQSPVPLNIFDDDSRMYNWFDDDVAENDVGVFGKECTNNNDNDSFLISTPTAYPSSPSSPWSTADYERIGNAILDTLLIIGHDDKSLDGVRTARANGDTVVDKDTVKYIDAINPNTELLDKNNFDTFIASAIVGDHDNRVIEIPSHDQLEKTAQIMQSETNRVPTHAEIVERTIRRKNVVPSIERLIQYPCGMLSRTSRNKALMLAMAAQIHNSKHYGDRYMTGYNPNVPVMITLKRRYIAMQLFEPPPDKMWPECSYGVRCEGMNEFYRDPRTGNGPCILRTFVHNPSTTTINPGPCVMCYRKNAHLLSIMCSLQRIRLDGINTCQNIINTIGEYTADSCILYNPKTGPFNGPLVAHLVHMYKPITVETAEGYTLRGFQELYPMPATGVPVLQHFQ